MARDIGYERDRSEAYPEPTGNLAVGGEAARATDESVNDGLDAANREIAEDNAAVEAIVTHIQNEGQPPLDPAVKARARHNNLMVRVYDRLPLGGPLDQLLADVTRQIIDPKGQFANGEETRRQRSMRNSNRLRRA